MEVNIAGDSLRGKAYDLWQTIRINGNVARTRVASIQAHSDTISLCFAVQAVDSVHVKCIVSPTAIQPTELTFPNTQCLLIECINDEGYMLADTIPLVAYSIGRPCKMKLNGMVYDAFDICGVRNSHIHPALWAESFGIANCIYYEAVPTDTPKR